MTSLLASTETPPRASSPSSASLATDAARGARAEDARWSAVVTRDRRADGTFVYAVATTGVYCQPSCGARLPRRENVSFFPSPKAAERGGYRACKRCRPNEPSRDRRAERVAIMCRMLDAADGGERPPLAALARATSLSPFHAHRLFKEVTGLTPRAYARARRDERMRESLSSATSVTDAIYTAGYGGASRFYARAKDALGMTASAYRAGGNRETIRYVLGECSLGAILVATTEEGVCALLLGDGPRALERDLAVRFPRATRVRADRDDSLAATLRRAVAHVEDPRRAASLPLDVRGTVFQARVWDALRKVAPGETTTYAALAAKLGVPSGARAVAAACAANPVAVLVPCHRVVRKDGALAGYRWGLARKRALLARETDETG